MPVIILHHYHQLPMSEMKNKIDKIVNSIEKRFEFRTEWETENLLLFRRKGASGSIEIDEQNFKFKLRLGLMFRAIKTQIEKEIIDVINKNLLEEVNTN